jgi:hypothetical protein
MATIGNLVKVLCAETGSHEETQGMARDLGMSPDELTKRGIGRAFNAEEITAARSLLAQSAQEVFDFAQKARGGSDADLAAFNEALTCHRAIQEQVSGITAEAGRALSAFRMMATVPDRAFALKRILENGGGREKLEKMAEDIATLPPEAIGSYVKNAAKATLYDKLYFIRINALVSGWKTHVANILGNTATALWSLPETTVAAGVSKLSRSGRAEGVMFGEVPRMITGMAQGTLEGFAAGARTLRTGETRGGISKLESQNQAPIGGVAGKVIGFPTRLLSAEDELFKAVAYRSKINSEALRVARSEGRTGDALFKRADDLRRNPTDAMIEAAEKHAKYQTFQSDMGAIARWFSQARNVPGLRYVAAVALPFIRTPANLFKYSMERSPLGFALREVRENISGKNGAAARDTQIARMALGTALEATVVCWWHRV